MALEDHALGLAIEEEVKAAIRVSSRTGEGMDQLKSEILRVAQGLSTGGAQPTSSELQ
jgi:50S ribosomal subunit-associated GTPase HflX